MSRPRFLRALLCLRLAAALPLIAVTLAPSAARAQSAADKATARELAVAGIKEFKKGNFAPALEKLQKAQALYDAHVHLVYIARCQVQLGQLIEAAESYRALARKPIPKDASDAVRSAQSEGAEELTTLEPRIPKLRIDVEPADVQGLQISINGQEVPAAIVGVDRPVNPGQVVVRVGAPGYKTGEASLTLAEGGKETVAIVLEEGEGGVPVVEASPGTTSGTPGSSAGTASGEPSPPPPKPVSFIMEPRASVFLPLGKIGDHAANKVVRGGVGGELRFGVHFLKRLTGLAMIEAHGLAPLSGFDSFALDGLYSEVPEADESDWVETASTKTVGRVAGGLGFMYSTPHHQLGYFVELDLLGEHMAGTTSMSIREGTPQDQLGFDQCSTDVMFTGGNARLNGGGVIPLNDLLALTPYISGAVGRFPKADLRGDCTEEINDSLDTIHGWLGLGVGVQFMLGE